MSEHKPAETWPGERPSLLLAGFTAEELDRECLRRAIVRTANALRRAELTLHLLRAKHDGQLAELAARSAKYGAGRRPAPEKAEVPA